MIIATMPKTAFAGSFGQLSPEGIEAELSRRGVYRQEPGVEEPLIHPPEAPEGQVIVVPPDGGPPTIYEPYLPVVPRPGAEEEEPEWEVYAPVEYEPGVAEKKPISKTALIVGGVIVGGLLLFGGTTAVGARAIPTRARPRAPTPRRRIPEQSRGA